MPSIGQEVVYSLSNVRIVYHSFFSFNLLYESCWLCS